MNWIQWRLNVAEQNLELLEQSLLDSGAASITYQNAGEHSVLEPDPGEFRLWDDLTLIALFDGTVDTKAIEKNISSLDVWSIVKSSKWELLEDKDWVRAWMDDYHPMQFGRNLWICPTGQQPPQPDATNLFLDPGLAFGTGTHPTTALCLEFLDGAIVGGETIIDYGCGSGVLALAAAKLGAKEIIGVDHDSQAVIATNENAKRNHLDRGHIKVFTPEEFQPFAADGVLANILAATLKQLAPEIVKLVKSGGWIALSGILESQIESVLAAYQPWFDMSEPILMDEWVLLTGTKY